MNILAIGDVVGKTGIDILFAKLRSFKRLKNIEFTIVNGENANGRGLTVRQANEIFDAGADVITLGNHAFGMREIAPFLDENEYILRPANFAPQLPGRGCAVYEVGRFRICVMNLIGRCMMDFGPDNPFLAADRLLAAYPADFTIIDFHAQATSEKLALGYYLDGRVSAVFGTHTHVQTADERVNPKGTGYITDVGMTGPCVSVLGVRPEQSIAFFRGDLAPRFETAAGECMIAGAIFDLDEKTGLCRSVERVQIR